MKWYNKILDKFGGRRLMNRAEYWQQVHAEIEHGSIRIIPGREHELLRDIAAIGLLIVRKYRRADSNDIDELVRRMELALATYAIVEDDKRQDIPPSANRMREVHLMDIPQ